MTSTLLGTLHTVLRGRARPYARFDGRPGGMSGIDKHPVTGPVTLTAQGLEGDEQGDRSVHGGPDKAIHHYAWEHYATWQAELGDLPVLRQPGAFGENFSTTGITEASLCWGDRVRVGSCLLELAQTRQPCWKLNTRFGHAHMARQVQTTGRTGWYWRVLEGGQVQAGDALYLRERPHPDWLLTRVLQVLYHQCLDSASLHALAQLNLPPSWQRLVQGRLQRLQVEDWDKRLEGAHDA